MKNPETSTKFQDHTGMTLFILKDRPMTFEEVLAEFKKMEFSFAFNYRHFFEAKIRKTDKKRKAKVTQDLNLLLQSGHITKTGTEGAYQITDLGIHDLQKFHSTIADMKTTISKVLNPKYSPIGSLIVHIIIGVLKLMGAFITGSAGLLGDGVDSLVDAISAIVVSVAMKYDREKQATYLLIILMCGSGVMVIYESILSVIHAEQLTNSTFGIVVTCLSIVLCSFLFLYQRVVGYVKRNLAVLAQSQDSKNHIIVGFLVLAGVVLGFFDLSIVDSIVGIIIGILILRGAYGLLQDIRAASKGEAVNYEKYKLGFWKKMESLQKQVLDFWVIWKIDSGYNSTETLTAVFESTFSTTLDDFLQIEVKRDAHLKKQETVKISGAKKLTDLYQTIDHLMNKKYITQEETKYTLTQQGRDYLHKKMEKLKRKRH